MLMTAVLLQAQSNFPEVLYSIDAPRNPNSSLPVSLTSVGMSRPSAPMPFPPPTSPPVPFSPPTSPPPQIQAASKQPDKASELHMNHSKSHEFENDPSSWLLIRNIFLIIGTPILAGIGLCSTLKRHSGHSDIETNQIEVSSRDMGATPGGSARTQQC